MSSSNTKKGAVQPLPFSVFELLIRQNCVTSLSRHHCVVARMRSAAKSENPSIPLLKPGIAPLFQSADMKRFDLKIFIYPELGSFAPQPGLLYTAERRDLGRDQAGVQAYHAEFQRLGNAP